MIINGHEYNIKWPMRSQYVFALEDVTASSGKIYRRDRGYTQDRIEATIVVKLDILEFDQFFIDIEPNNIDITFAPEETVFGTDVSYDDAYNVVITDRSQNRVNTTYYEVALNISLSDAVIPAVSVSDPMGLLYYPTNYNLGTTYNAVSKYLVLQGDVEVYDYLNDFNTTTMSFSMPHDRVREVKRHIVNTIRGDVFTLPVDWQSLNSLSGNDKAYITGMSEEIVNLTTSNLTLVVREEKYA